MYVCMTRVTIAKAWMMGPKEKRMFKALQQGKTLHKGILGTIQATRQVHLFTAC